MKFTVSELYRNVWQVFAVVPAATPEAAIAAARRIGMRPKDRQMKAAKYKVTKR